MGDLRFTIYDLRLGGGGGRLRSEGVKALTALDGIRGFIRGVRGGAAGAFPFIAGGGHKLGDEVGFFDGGGPFGAANEVVYRTSGRRAAAAKVDAIRFMFSTGTIASGTFNLYGRKK